MRRITLLFLSLVLTVSTYSQAVVNSYSHSEVSNCDAFTYDPFATDVINKMVAAGATVDDTRKGYINQLVTCLRDNGIWDQTAVLLMLNAPTDAASLYNWRNVWCNIPTKISAPTFSANSGYTGDGVDDAINTHWQETKSQLTTQNSFTIWAWDLTNAAHAGLTFGVNNGGGVISTGLVTKRADNSKTSFGANGAAPLPQTTGTMTDSRGFYVTQRTNGTQVSLYKNGVLLETVSSNSTGVPGLDYYLLAQNAGGSVSGPSNKRISVWGAGSGSINQATLYSCISTYMTQIGAAEAPPVVIDDVQRPMPDVSWEVFVAILLLIVIAELRSRKLKMAA